MRDGLRRAFRGGLAQAEAWVPGTDPEGVLEALALAIVLDLVDELGSVTASERSLLRERGRRALLAGPPAEDPPDPEDWQRARSLAQAGLALLEGRVPEAEPSTAHPTAAALGRMLDGRPDGLTAGARAHHARTCESCLAAVRVLRMAGGESLSPPLAVAAAGGATMRAPMEGRPVGRLSAPEVEAYLFEDGDRQLAIYATASEPVRLVAEGVTTEQMLSGYWLGRVTTSDAVIRGRLHVGQLDVDWDIDLTAG